ncbi:MAG TPA: M56 family metallopeptidase, partial [Hyphomonadaceae bacterium]|nr:M56 family metallopeptidase [Hyphomonadaceae bacterium]
MSEFALRFLLANLAIGAAVLVVLALRMPMRAMFGARLTYAMWLLVPLAGLASLLPPRVEQIVNFVSPAPEPSVDAQGSVPWDPMLEMPDQAGSGPEIPAPPQLAGPVSVTRDTSGFEMPNPIMLALIAWLVGVIGMAAWQLRRQARFVSDAKAGFAGPAVVGVIHPRIVTPSDFETTFDASEREMILTHERIHIEGNDARINALAA